MTMNAEGAKEWARLTKENIGRSVAIVLDGMVYSAPTVQVEITGGRSQITGHFTPEEAKDLANVLKSGKMAASVHIVQEDVVGPSLGQEAINSGIISFIIALILLMIYMADMAVQCYAGNAARGMSLVALHNGGGVGIGKAINGGFGLVLDGSLRVDEIIRSAIIWDVMSGVARRSCKYGRKCSHQTVQDYGQSGSHSGYRIDECSSGNRVPPPCTHLAYIGKILESLSEGSPFYR